MNPHCNGIEKQTNFRIIKVLNPNGSSYLLDLIKNIAQVQWGLGLYISISILFFVDLTDFSFETQVFHPSHFIKITSIFLYYFLLSEKREWCFIEVSCLYTYHFYLNFILFCLFKTIFRLLLSFNIFFFLSGSY